LCHGNPGCHQVLLPGPSVGVPFRNLDRSTERLRLQHVPYLSATGRREQPQPPAAALATVEERQKFFGVCAIGSCPLLDAHGFPPGRKVETTLTRVRRAARAAAIR